MINVKLQSLSKIFQSQIFLPLKTQEETGRREKRQRQQNGDG